MAWTDILSTDTDIGSPIDEDLTEGLRANQLLTRAALFGVSFAEVTTASATYVTVQSVRVYVPDLDDYTGIQRELTAEIEAKVSNASGVATYMLEDDSSGDTGSEVTTSATSYGWQELTLDLDATWAGTNRTINIQAKITGGYTAYARSENAVSWRVAY